LIPLVNSYLDEDFLHPKTLLPVLRAILYFSSQIHLNFQIDQHHQFDLKFHSVLSQKLLLSFILLH